MKTIKRLHAQIYKQLVQEVGYVWIDGEKQKVSQVDMDDTDRVQVYLEPRIKTVKGSIVI